MSTLSSNSVCLHCAWCMCACVCTYISTYLWVIVHFVWWTPMVRGVTLSKLWVLLTLWCEYALKATTVYAYSCHIVCMIIAVWLFQSMSASDIDFLVYATCINMFDAFMGFDSPEYEHVEARRIHRHKTLSMHHSAPNVKLCRIFAEKMGYLCCCILTVKAWWEYHFVCYDAS